MFRKYIYIFVLIKTCKAMKTIRTVTTVFEIESDDFRRRAIIIGTINDEYFVKNENGIMIYTKKAMNKIYGIDYVSLTNIQKVYSRSVK